MGWPDHPLFGQGVASATPYGRYGVAEATPRPLGVVRPPRKPPRKKKKKKTKWVCAVGGGWTTPKGLGVVVGGGRSHPRPLGVVRPPPTAQTHFIFFFFFLGGFRGGRTTPKGLGVASATPYRSYGVAEATLDFPFFFFFFLFFLKKKNSEMGQNYTVLGKTASFWASPKQHSFGVKGSVGIYIFIYPLYP
jgi:hypothetical protein